MRVAGIMSGTSLDGIDVAIVDIRVRKLALLAYRTTPYPDAVRQEILAVSNANTHTAAISRLNFVLGELYAQSVRATCKAARIPLKSVELIGCHGQTIYHEGTNTLQIGEAAVMAERLGIPVVSDFRTRDIAAGGGGAPLVPFLDFRLFRHRTRHRILLNIGGIANFTSIPEGARLENVIAFDTGPGNMVIDALVREYSNGNQLFDSAGAIAAGSTVNRKLLNELTRDPYFRKKPPKTAGREQYGAEFVVRMKASGDSVSNLIATATALTAVTIAQAIQRFAPNPDDLIVAGGGVHNRQLMGTLHALLPDVRIATTANFGIDPDAKEAVAFALLAYETWHHRPGNVPGATGALRPVILGKVTFSK